MFLSGKEEIIEWLIQQLGHESIVITRNSYEGKIEPNYDNMPKVVF